MADAKKKGGNLSPEAAKILEAYRNAGKAGAKTNADGTIEDENTTSRPATTPANNAMPKRSGTRGK